MKEIIKAYAHDYRDMNLSEKDLEEMLWKFWHEQLPLTKKEFLSQFCSNINSHGFMKWYLNTN